jgi:hypothetical protein
LRFFPGFYAPKDVGAVYEPRNRKGIKPA